MNIVKRLKNIVAVFLAIILVVSALPLFTVSVKADPNEDYAYTVLEDFTAEITKYNGSDTIVTVPEYLDDYLVTSIGEKAFMDCNNITKVTLPDTITKIRYCAFKNCSSLMDIIIPDQVTIIGSCSFQNCTSLTTISLPDSVEYLLSQAFSGCSNLAFIKLSESIINLDYIGIFENCTSLDNVIIPGSVTAVGEDVFSNCTGLKSITFSEGLITLGARAFNECTSLTHISFPDSLTTIKTQCFYHCNSLQNIEIPANVTNVHYTAFQGCDLESISVNPNNAVYDSRNSCNAIIDSQTNTLLIGCENTTIPDSVTSIDKSAFSYCSGLTSIIIPDTVTNIGNNAFSNCTALGSAQLGNNLSSIGTNVFFGCNNLETVILPEGLTSITNSMFSGCSSLKSITLPGSVKSIGTNAFKDCIGLESIVIPEGVTSIGDSAFQGCNSLESVELPDSLTTIGESAFKECSNLTSIIIPRNTTKILAYAFQNCRKLEQLTISEGVTTIGGQAFHNCERIKRVVIPASVNSIGQYALGYYTFAYYKVEDFVILGTAGSAAETYAKNNGFAFYESIPADYTAVEAALAMVPEDLMEYTLESVAVLQDAIDNIDYNKYAYEQDEVNQMALALKNAVGHLRKILDYRVLDSETAELTDYNDKRESLIIPTEIDGYKIVRIGDGAFRNSQGLIELTIPESVISIGEEAFYGISTLTKVSLPKSLNSIETKAFLGCNALEGVLIEDNISSIGEYAFGFDEDLDTLEGFSITGYRGSAAEQYAFVNELIFIPIDADYSAVDEALALVPVDLDNYTADSVAALQAAINAVIRGKVAEEQVTVDQMASDILEAIQDLNPLADYTAVDAALAKIPETLNDYTEDSVAALQLAVNAVVRGKGADEQEAVDQMAADIFDAVQNLKQLADYSAVDVALAKIPENLNLYTADSVAALQVAVNAVVRGKAVDEQAAVDKMARDIEEAILALEIPEPPSIDEEHLAEAIEGMARYVVNHSSPNDVGNYVIKKTSTGSNSSDSNMIIYYPSTNKLGLFLIQTVDLEYVATIDMIFALDNKKECEVGVSIASISGFPNIISNPTVMKPYYYVIGEKTILFDIRSSEIDDDLTQELCNTFFDYAITQWHSFLYNLSKNQIFNFGFCSMCEHKWEVGYQVLQEPTCDTNGIKARTCSLCSYLDRIEIPSTDHTWGAWSETKPATVYAKGEETRYCSICGNKQTREIPALDLVFNDVQNPKAWYYDTVYKIAKTLNDKGHALMSGYSNGSGNFGPADPLTRQDFAVILYRLADEPEAPDMENPFKDTNPKGYYYPSVLWAKAENVIAGYNDGRFGVGDKITREQVATILYRFAKDYLEIDTEPALEAGDLSKFTDGKAVSSWAEEALTWATGAGVITGKDGGTRVDARGNAARAEIGAMILRFIAYVN